jgi:hypothetical protein
MTPRFAQEFPMSGAHRSAEAHGEATMNENGAFVGSGGDLQNRFCHDE